MFAWPSGKDGTVTSASVAPREAKVRVAASRAAAIGGGGVPRVVAGERLEHERAVLGGAGHRAGVVERPGEGQYPRLAHPAEGRLEAGDAAERGRPADRAARVG